MPKSKIILILGAIIALLPMLGFPHSWEAVFQVLAGLSIISLSVWANIDKKLKLQIKAQQRQARKTKETQSVDEPPMMLNESDEPKEEPQP